MPVEYLINNVTYTNIMFMNAEKIKTIIINYLINGGLDFDIHQNAIGLEVQFSKKQRHADMLIINSDLHALEIKSDLDDLKKLFSQIDDYSKTFNRVSVVLTPKHIDEARFILPQSIGILLISDRNSISVIRKAKTRTNLDKESVLKFLSKNEICKLINIKNNNLYTDEIRQIAEEKLPLKSIITAVNAKLHKKYRPLFTLMLSDLGKDVTIDDLQSLYGSINIRY